MLNLLSYKTTVYFISKRSLRLQRLDGFYFSSFAALNLYGEWKQLSTKRTNSSAFPLTDESIYFFFSTFCSSFSQGPEQVHVSKFYKEAKMGMFMSYISEDARTLYETFRRGSYESNNGPCLGWRDSLTSPYQVCGDCETWNFVRFSTGFFLHLSVFVAISVDEFQWNAAQSQKFWIRFDNVGRSTARIGGHLLPESSRMDSVRTRRLLLFVGRGCTVRHTRTRCMCFYHKTDRHVDGGRRGR